MLALGLAFSGKSTIEMLNDHKKSEMCIYHNAYFIKFSSHKDIVQSKSLILKYIVKALNQKRGESPHIL